MSWRLASSALLAILFAAKLGVALWSLDRGFDLGDGGILLLSLNRPADSPEIYEFYKLLTLFDPPLRFDVVDARLLRLAAEGLGTLLLAFSVFGWARARFPAVAREGLLSFLLFTLLGSLLSVASQIFGYNDGTTLVSYTAVACWFRLLSLPADDAARPRRWLWAAATGFAVGFQLFVKFPTALLLMAALMLLSGFVVHAPLRDRIGRCAAHLAGAAAAIALFVWLNGGVGPLREKLETAFHVRDLAGGYEVSDILRVYWRHDRATYLNGLRFATVFGVVLGACRLRFGSERAALDRSLAAALLAGGGVLAQGVRRLHPGNVDPTLLYLFCLVGLLAAVGWIATLRGGAETQAPGERRERAAALLLLLALPFLDIAGTNVALTLRLPTHIMPIFVVLAIAFADLRERVGYRVFPAVSVALLAMSTSLVFVQHAVQKPYGLPAPIYRQVHPVRGLPELRVDLATKVFLENLLDRMTKAGFRPGDPVIALDFMPGLIYYLDARSPGFLYFLFDEADLNCWLIDRAALQQTPFLILGLPMTHEQHDCIRSFDYPEQFRQIATIGNPYEWAYPYFFGLPNLPYVYLFAPAERAKPRSEAPSP